MEFPGFLDGNGLEICFSSEFLVVVDDDSSVVATTGPVDPGLMEIGFPERIGFEDVLGFNGHTAVDYVVVVGADDFVPVPRGGTASCGIVGVSVDDGDVGGRVFFDELVCCADTENAGSEDQVGFVGHCCRIESDG